MLGRQRTAPVYPSPETLLSFLFNDLRFALGARFHPSVFRGIPRD